MFRPVYTTRPTGEGTGLGLALVHEVVVRLPCDVAVATAEPAVTGGVACA